MWTLNEVAVGYEKIRPAIVELDLIDKENTTFISSRYREANLFVSRANGDEYANFTEMHDLYIHIMSGLKRAKKNP